MPMKMEKCDGLAAKWNFARGTLNRRIEVGPQRHVELQNGCGLLLAASAYLSLRGVTSSSRRRLARRGRFRGRRV